MSLIGKRAAAVVSSALMMAVGVGATSAQAATGSEFTVLQSCPSSGKITGNHSCTTLSSGVLHHLKTLGQNGVTIHTRYEKNSGSSITAKLGYVYSGSTYYGSTFTQSSGTTKKKEWVRSSWTTQCYTTTGVMSVTGQGVFQTPTASC